MRNKTTLKDLFKNDLYFDNINDTSYEVVDLQKFVSTMSSALKMEFELIDISCFFTKFKRNEEKENIDFNYLVEEINNTNNENRNEVDEERVNSISNQQKENGIAGKNTNNPNSNSDVLV